MKKLIVILMLFVISSSFCYAFLTTPISILDVSQLGNITIKINLTNKEEVFCLQGGNCNISNATVTTTNYENYNVTGDFNVSGNLNVEGNVTGSNLFGYLNFSWIENWDFSFIYNGIESYILQHFYNKTQSDARYLQSESDPIWNADKGDYYTAAEADALFCTECGGGSGETGVFEIYFNQSTYSVINNNFTESDSSIIEVYTTDGEKFVFGGELT